MKKKLLILNIAVIVVLCFVIVVAYLMSRAYIEKNRAISLLNGNTELTQIYEKALLREKQILNEPNEYEHYIGAFFYWKSLGDATQNQYFYRKSLKILESGMKNEQATSAIYYLNAGNVYRALGEYEKSALMYENAVKMNTGDAQMWLAYLDLYKYWPKKTSTEVIALYDRALSALIDKMNVSIDKASYLAEIGRYEEALAIYESIYAVYPERKELQEKVSDLKYLIKSQNK